MNERSREHTSVRIRQAILRISKGRPRDSKNVSMSISSVAREAGITPGCIHNSYPEYAREIRERSHDVGSRFSRSNTPTNEASRSSELKTKIRALTARLREEQKKNRLLMDEVARLQYLLRSTETQEKARKVLPFPPRKDC